MFKVESYLGTYLLYLDSFAYSWFAVDFVVYLKICLVNFTGDLPSLIKKVLLLVLNELECSLLYIFFLIICK